MNLKKKFDVITQAGLRFQKNLCELGHKCTEDSKRLRVVLCAFEPLRESNLRETSFSQRRKTGFATGNILTTESAQGLNVALVFTNNIVAHNAYGVIGIRSEERRAGKERRS